jgi:hypothetical protein
LHVEQLDNSNKSLGKNYDFTIKNKFVVNDQTFGEKIARFLKYGP